MSPRRLQKAKVPLIFFVALAAFFLWLLPLLLGGNPQHEALISLVWLIALSAAFAGIILSDRFRARQMRTLFVTNHEAYCIGCGNFSYDDHLDLLEKSIMMVNNAAKNKQVATQMNDFNARYVIKTKSFAANQARTNEGKTIKSLEQKGTTGSFSQYDDALLSSDGFFAARPDELAVRQWTGKVESLHENESWYFSNIDELENILERLFPNQQEPKMALAAN